MKKSMIYRAAMGLVVTALSGQIAPALRAQTPNPAPVAASQPAQSSPAVQEVLKLAHANVSDDTIIAFIHNSGTTYNLSASEIVSLRQQGVSDPVITAMVSSQQNAQAAAQVAPPVPAAPTPLPQGATNQPPPDMMQAAPTYDATAPIYAAPAYSYAAPTYGYYGGAPYYWGYPGVSLGIGLGGFYGGYYGHPYGGYHGYYRGGFYGGGYHGGYHGGHR
jgi:hypothetical protein